MDLQLWMILSLYLTATLMIVPPDLSKNLAPHLQQTVSLRENYLARMKVFNNLVFSILMFSLSGNYHECYDIDQKCDFYSDCQDNSDEEGCPRSEFFENCQAETGLDNCGWEEDPHDDLDWVIATKEDTVAGHPIIREGKFLWIKKNGNDENAKAHIEGPTYQNSRVDCYIEFYYFKSGSVGSIINPSLHLLDSHTLIVLDSLPHTSQWSQKTIQIGRHEEEFKIVFDRPKHEAYDAGVAVDDIDYVDCDMPRPIDKDAECPEEKSFRCENDVCLEFQRVCDFTDDCGDGSDELPSYCKDNYIGEDFEDDSKPFGIFHEEPGDNLHWQKQSGPTSHPQTGPSTDHTSFNLTGHYLYLDSNKMENTEERALLVSEPFLKSSEDGPDCVMILNYHMYGAGLGTLQVSMRASAEEAEVLFQVNGSDAAVSKNTWRRKEILVEKSRQTEEFVITISANVMIQNQGDIAVDDIVFSPQCIMKSSGTSPQTTMTTSSSSSCDVGSQFTCGDGSCIPLPDVCNFHIDCPNDDLDEKYCPDLYTFENCNSEGAGGPDNCGWSNSIPDTLDWQVMSLEELVQESLPHHPETDFENKASGHMLYMRNVMGGSVAGVASPVYESSYTECLLTFYLYMSGSSDFFLYPTLTHSFMGMTTELDMIQVNNISFPDAEWVHVLIGIGQHKDKFTVGFDLVYSGEDWQSSVAVDQVEFLECGSPRGSETCEAHEYHCEVTKACIDQTMLCDYADNCGDGSDEDFAYQDCDKYLRINFEDPLNPWGFFNETQSEQGFSWTRGNGTVKAGTGPPFDHTLFSPIGHYLYISSEDQEVGEVAWLTTPIIEQMTESDNCSVRFFYHMHGSGVGKLTLYLQ